MDKKYIVDLTPYFCAKRGHFYSITQAEQVSILEKGLFYNVFVHLEKLL